MTRLGAVRLVLSTLAVWAVLAVALTGGAQAAPVPFRGTALWISNVPAQATPDELAAFAVATGVRGLYINAGDGSTPNAQFTPGLVHGLKADGISVCAWIFVYGVDPQGEAAVALSAVHNGAQCLIVDAEGQYDGRYNAAQLFVRRVRADVGASFPIGLAGQAEVAQHPTFPYSVFLGPGGFNYDLPQIYWRDFGDTVDRAFQLTMGANAIYGRPIVPVGQLYGAPSPAAVSRFRALAGAYGCIGLSFFSLDAAAPASLATLRGPAQSLPLRSAVPPTIRSGADGDQVVWAQELLNAAGAKLPVGGFFGNETIEAVSEFQIRHHLRADGVLDPATWKLLMHLKAKEPSWAKAPPQSAR